MVKLLGDRWIRICYGLNNLAITEFDLIHGKIILAIAEFVFCDG